MDRTTLCEEICAHARIKRQNPTRKLLSKREMQAILKELILRRNTITQMEGQNEKLRKG